MSQSDERSTTTEEAEPQAAETAASSEWEQGVTPAPPTGGAPVQVRRTKFSVLWTTVIIAALVLVLLLIFIVQNNNDVQLAFLGWQGKLPVGVAMLFAAVAGVLLVAIPGYGRILQLRRAVRKAGKPR